MEIYTKNEFNNIISNSIHKQCRYNILVFDKIIYENIGYNLPLTIQCSKCCKKCGKSKPKYNQNIVLDKTEYNFQRYDVDAKKLEHNHVLIKKEYYCEFTANNISIMKKKIFNCSSYLKTCKEEINKNHKCEKYLKYCIVTNICDITNKYVFYKFETKINNIITTYSIYNYLDDYTVLNNELLISTDIDIKSYEIDENILKIYQIITNEYIIQGYKYKSEKKNDILELENTNDTYLNCLENCNENNLVEIIYDDHYSDVVVYINYKYNNKILKCLIKNIINQKNLTSFCTKCDNHTHSYIDKEHHYDSNERMWDNSYKTWDEISKKCIICNNVKDKYNDNYYYSENTYGHAIYKWGL